MTDDVRFTDPFNDTHGIEAMRTIFDKMYRDVAEPKFVVSRVAFDGDVCLMQWKFTGRSLLGALSIEGMSTLCFDDDGRVAAHMDHWDPGASVYERLPLIGRAIGFIRKRL